MKLSRAVELAPKDMILLREAVITFLKLFFRQEARRYQALLAHYFFDKQEAKEAVHALEQLMCLDPYYFEAYDMLGQVYESVGQYEDATHVYEKLACLNPNGSIAKQRLAVLLARLAK